MCRAHFALNRKIAFRTWRRVARSSHVSPPAPLIVEIRSGKRLVRLSVDLHGLQSTRGIKQEDNMSRFRMLDRLLDHDEGFREFFTFLTGGTSGHDHLNGTSG